MARRLRFSLFTKIVLWLFANLVVIAAALIVFFNLQFRLASDLPFFALFPNRLESAARLIGDEMRAASDSEKSAILRRYSLVYRVEFSLYSRSGERLAGSDRPLPVEVLRHLAEPPPRPFPPPEAAMPMPPPFGGVGAHRHFPGPEGDLPPPPRPSNTGRLGPPPRQHPAFTLKTVNPTRYWAGVRLDSSSRGQFEPMRATLLAGSDSMFGHGLFFDPTPWLMVTAVVLALSILLWLPFVRSLTVTVKQMTVAAERIADERFEVRVNEKRSDELGRLGSAINQLAARLAGFVYGQKRFLGDISHELNSPLGRLQLALGILEERADPAQLGYVADAREEVQLMSQLVSELLAFAKAGMKTADVRLVNVPLLPLVRQICAREAANCEAEIHVGETDAAVAQPELLKRALANILRNSSRYAAGCGAIVVGTQRRHDRIILVVADHGPGVPPESLNRLFDPLYRLEPDRSRATGGSGLGLTIARTCIEACRGIISARNLSPSGLEISIDLEAGAAAESDASGGKTKAASC